MLTIQKFVLELQLPISAIIRGQGGAAYAFRIIQLFHEASVFLHARNVESLGLRSDRIHEVIIRNCC